MDDDRDIFFRSKINAYNGLDNYSDLQHEVCAEYGHTTEKDLGYTPQERESTKCFAVNMPSKNFFTITWSDIAEAIKEAEFNSGKP